MTCISFSRARLLAGASLTAAALLSTQAHAQNASLGETGGLSEIIVTAQKREQSLQDVPVAVTAITATTLEANRVTNVVDLSAIAPGFTVRPSLGGSAIPFMATRGALSGAVVPGADKQISIYLDGVYIQAVRGSIFELPDVERIEMLRGPQGTLFGRNATAGAVSISTRDPAGEAKIKASASYGNRDHYRFRLTADTPQIGPFSAYVSYVHDEARGYTRNALGGMVFDFSKGYTGQRLIRSADWLGGKDADNWFAAVKFDPGAAFTAVYKYDRSESAETNPPLGILGIDESSYFAPLYRALLATGYSSPIVLDLPQTSRPKVAYNGLNSATDQFQEGHNLTMVWEASDAVTVKNIAAYRHSGIFSSSNVDAISGLTFTAEASAAFPGYPAMFIGSPFIVVSHTPSFDSKQWSNELQVNYQSDLLTATAGGLYFKSKELVNHHGYQNSFAFEPFLNGVAPLRPGIAYNEQKSIAGYVQGEFHLTSQLDIALGARVTNDKKSGTFSYGNPANLTVYPSKYTDTRFTYLIGANYKPTDDIMIYGKWSTGYVSGGTVGPVPYNAETAKSAEFGFKGDFLNRRLRTNLALYWVRYTDLQSTAAVSTLGSLVDELTGDPALTQVFGTFILPQGNVTAKGFELEVTAAPTDGLTVGGSLSYNKSQVKNVPAFAKKAVGLPENAPDSDFTLSLQPDWTASLYAQYTTQPLFADTYASFRLDGVFQGRTPGYQNQKLGIPAFEHALSIPSYWLVNGRAALNDINLGGIQAELAVWGKNILDEDIYAYPIIAAGMSTTTYVAARSYGIDLTIQF